MQIFPVSIYSTLHFYSANKHPFPRPSNSISFVCFSSTVSISVCIFINLSIIDSVFFNSVWFVVVSFQLDLDPHSLIHQTDSRIVQTKKAFIVQKSFSLFSSQINIFHNASDKAPSINHHHLSFRIIPWCCDVFYCCRTTSILKLCHHLVRPNPARARVCVSELSRR